jgi:hypothetical protein
MDKRFDYPDTIDLKPGLKLEKCIQMKRAIAHISGLFTSRVVDIEIYNTDLHNYITSNEGVLVMFQEKIKKLIIEILGKLLIYGFFFYRRHPRSKTEIEIIDFSNGELRYRVDDEHIVDLWWKWNPVRNIRGGSKLNIEFDDGVPLFYHIDKSPTHDGKLNGYMTPFVEDFERMISSEANLVGYDRRNLDPVMYLQKISPPYQNDQFKHFQDYTMMKNARLTDLISSEQRLFNMHGVLNGLEAWSEDWMRTHNRMKRFMNIRNFFDFKYNYYDTGLIPASPKRHPNEGNSYPDEYSNCPNQKPKKYPVMTAGELITPKFYPQPKKPSDLYKMNMEGFENRVEEHMGLNFQKYQALKEQSRLVGFLMRGSMMCIHSSLEKGVNKIMNHLYVQILKEAGSILPEEKEEDVLKIGLNRIQYISESELTFLVENGASRDEVSDMLWGEEFSRLFKGTKVVKGKED